MCEDPSDVDLAQDAGDLRTIPGSPQGFTPVVSAAITGKVTGAPTAVDAAAFGDLLPEDTFFNGKLYVSNRHDPFENGMVPSRAATTRCWLPS